MLKQMRQGAKSTVLKLLLFGLLLLAMAGLALMDVQGMFRSGATNGTVASIGRNKITAVEFDRLVQNTLREQRLKQSDAYRDGLPLQILQQEIDKRLFSMAAADLGLQADDALAAKQIKEILAPLVAQGVTAQEALQRLLTTYNLSENQLVAAVKGEIASQQLFTAVTSGAHAPQQLVNDMLRYRHEWRRGEYFTLTADNIEALKDFPDAELQSYYESVASEYALPETRTLSVIVLDKKALGDVVKISDDRLRAYYDENIQDYTTPETRIISQVVAEDEASARAGKGTQIKPAPVTEAEMPVELSKPAFAGQAGQTLPPIQSPLGWHVLTIGKVTPGTVKSFDSVKAEIEKDLTQDKVSEALYERANKLDDEIAGGKTLAEVAKENNIPVTTLVKIDARGLDQDGKKPDTALPLFDKIVENGFSLKKGASSPLIETSDSAFVIVSAEEIFPSQQKPFNEVRGAILTRWKTNHQIKALSEKSAAILARLKKGDSFAKIAAEFNKPVQSTELLKRGTPAFKAGVTDSMMTALFSIDTPGQTTSVSGDGSLTLLRLAERKMQPPAVASKEDTEAMTAVLNRALKQGLLEQYKMSLMNKYDVTINSDLLATMYAPKDDGANGEE